MRDREPREPTTVLDHLRPTVVVRRRVVVDVAALNQPKLESPGTTEPEPTLERSSGCYPRANVALDDESTPPSSIIAPEGYETFGYETEDEVADEEQEEQEEQEQEEDRAPSTREPLGIRLDDARAVTEEEPWPAVEEPSAEVAPVPDPRPTIPVGPTIAVGTIAKRLGLPSAQVAAELVSRGFFEVTAATVLTRETARIVAEAFGRAVEEIPDPEPVKVKVKTPRKRTARRAAPAKRTAKTGPKPKKRTGRSTRRAA